MHPFLDACQSEFDAKIIPLPSDLYDYEKGAEALLKVVECDSPYLLVAESFSGPLALYIAKHQPQNLRAIVLSATFTRPPLLKELLVFLAHFLPQWHAGWIKKIASFLLCNTSTSSFATMAIHAFESLPYNTAKGRLRSIARVHAEALLSSCPVPVLILTASQDTLLWRDYEPTVYSYPHIQCQKIKAPHMLLSHAPKEALACITKFYKQLSYH